MELHNYRKLRSCKVEFPDGVIGIVGPNGVGKSSLIEAIAWALYGSDSTSARTGKEGIRWMGADPSEDCSVLLEFEMSGDRYRLLRGLRGKGQRMEATLEVNGNLEASGDTAVNETITRRLGMDYKAFYISVFARQKDLNALSTLIPSRRKELILRMLNIDVLGDVIQDIGADIRRLEDGLERERGRLRTADGRDRIEVLREEKEGIDSRIQELERTLEQKREQIASFDERVQALRDERGRLQELEEDYLARERAITKTEISLRELEERMAGLEREIGLLREKESELEELEGSEEEYRRLSERKASMEEERRLFERWEEMQRRKEALVKRRDTLRRELEEERNRLERMGSPEISLQRVEGSIAEVEKGIGVIRQRIGWISSEMGRLSDEVRKISEKKEEIERLGPNSSCPTCERPLGEHQALLRQKLSRQIDETSERIEELGSERGRLESELEREEKRREVLLERRRRLSEEQSEVASLRTSIGHLEEKERELTGEIDEVSSSMEEISVVAFDQDAFDELSTELERLAKAVKRYQELSVEVRRIPLLEDEREDIREKLSDLGRKLDILRREMRETAYEPGGLRRVQETLERLMEERERIYETFTEVKQELALLRKDLSNREEKLEEMLLLRKQVEELLREKNLLDILREVMNGFWVDIISRIAPTLSRISSSLFAEMTDSKYEGMDLDGDSYEVYIFDGGERYPLSRFSGGESDLANLCLRLAISNVIAERAGSSVNFLILDEIFGSQDQVRKRNIMTSLNQLANHFSQIILITHIDDVKDYMGHVLRVVEREDGTSDVILET